MDYMPILSRAVAEYRKILADKLTGIYVHGSIAFHCFHWESSDIDFLAVVDSKPTQNEKEALIRVLLELSDIAPPKGLEMSVVLREHCANFKYPTPFELHYSNMHMPACQKDLKRYCTSMNGTDKDLAAHFTVIKKVGFTLIGKPIDEVFGNVPEKNYEDSIKADIANAKEEIGANPVYVVLNLCRVLAYIQSGLIFSKEQGGYWGLENMDGQFHDLINSALSSYKSGAAMVIDREKALYFCAEYERLKKLFTAT